MRGEPEKTKRGCPRGRNGATAMVSAVDSRCPSGRYPTETKLSGESDKIAHLPPAHHGCQRIQRAYLLHHSARDNRGGHCHLDSPHLCALSLTFFLDEN